MKYDILVQTFEFTGSKTIFAKKKNFSPKIGEFFLSKYVSGYYKTKKKKKMAWTTKPLV